MTSYQKPNVTQRCANFHAGFKNLFGFALAISESARPAPYFEGSLVLIF